jgi:hypothetical protein
MYYPLNPLVLRPRAQFWSRSVILHPLTQRLASKDGVTNQMLAGNLSVEIGSVANDN